MSIQVPEASAPFREDCLARLTVIQALAPDDLSAVLEIRRRVFAEEQRVAGLRVSDPDDARSIIGLASLHQPGGTTMPGLPVSTGRLTFSPTGGPALVAWVATVPEARGQGFGNELMRFLLSAADRSGVPEVILAAQSHAERFYRRLGFFPSGPLYDVRGIPHRRMSRRHPR